ncbi:hypothetical protein [Streptomyces zagrosensis]|uniref:Uncharacterized protein n=1 Tax=Streptomyces zagrosensis TaxID=1042984 RepID=A0A7W9QD46_9ACTN|nr:hypothetical protein [Streptomyces zagrosensis]MBB5938065.1 hypothetical protein [Streptomyces zagrosensis]
MVNIETVPIARVLRRAERAYDEVNKLWLARSRECGIFATDGSFLAAGSMKLGWFRVCLTPQTDLSLMADEQGDIEFLARASDGREVCGVTTEGSEFWIVVISMTRR